MRCMPGTHTTHSHNGTFRGNKESPINLMCLIWTVGGSLRTQRKPPQTQGEHVKSSKKGLDCPQTLPPCCELPTTTLCCVFFFFRFFGERQKKVLHKFLKYDTNLTSKSLLLLQSTERSFYAGLGSRGVHEGWSPDDDPFNSLMAAE